MHRLLLSYRGETRRFLQFELRDHADGSLLVVLDRPGISIAAGQPPEKPERFRISYHSSGRANFRGFQDGKHFINCEPIFAISKPQLLAAITLREIGVLPRFEGGGKIGDTYRVADTHEGRITFQILLLPHGWRTSLPACVIVGYAPWFDIAVVPSLPPEIPASYAHAATYTLVPTSGPFERQVLSKHDAKIFFHQRRLGVQGQIWYFDELLGIYRVIFAVTMRRVPDIIVEFLDPQLESKIEQCSESEVRFRVRGPGGYVRNAVAIKSITASAVI